MSFSWSSYEYDCSRVERDDGERNWFFRGRGDSIPRSEKFSESPRTGKKIYLIRLLVIRSYS